MFLILFAGLRILPKEPFEAARVDGASDWRIFWDLTFPMLIPASLMAGDPKIN
jgi:multiple sugar transport system permease protein